MDTSAAARAIDRCGLIDPMNESDATEQQDPDVIARPLHPEDPVRVGDFWLDARLYARTTGVVYAAHPAQADTPGPGSQTPPAATPAQPSAPTGSDPDEALGASSPVALVLLSAGAAGDRVARDRFSGEVNPLHIDLVLARGGEGQDHGRLGRRFRESHAPISSDRAEAPWVALPREQAGLGARMLAEVELSTLPPHGEPSGPDYRLPWAEDEEPGRAPLWPLPWPGRHDRAGWVTLLISWLIMVVLTILAVLLAILMFRNEPPQTPPPPQPQTATESSSAESSPDSSSPSPDSASPSPDSASPSPDSASPSPSGSGEPGPRSKL